MQSEQLELYTGQALYRLRQIRYAVLEDPGEFETQHKPYAEVLIDDIVDLTLATLSHQNTTQPEESLKAALQVTEPQYSQYPPATTYSFGSKTGRNMSEWLKQLRITKDPLEFVLGKNDLLQISPPSDERDTIFAPLSSGSLYLRMAQRLSGTPAKLALAVTDTLPYNKIYKGANRTVYLPATTSWPANYPIDSQEGNFWILDDLTNSHHTSNAIRETLTRDLGIDASRIIG